MFKTCRNALRLEPRLQYQAGPVWNVRNLHLTCACFKKSKYNPYMAKRNSVDTQEPTNHVKKTTIPVVIQHLQLQTREETDDTGVSNDEHLERLEKSLKALEDELHQHQKQLEQSLRGSSELDDDIEIKGKETSVRLDRRLVFGTANSEIPVSDVPCGGCGAMLHCQNTAIPGFLPQEKFTECDKKELESMLCQRCHYMTHFKKVIDVQADNNVYQEVIKKIQHEKRAFILMLVDATDIRHTFIKDLLKGISKKIALYLICNKFDLIPKDGPKLFSRIKKALFNECEKAGVHESQIRHTAFISAKTGYGVEDLISKIIGDWDHEGHIYMVGTTNSGKSTLFNTFLDSDLCKADVRDIVQRATISNWPGTTLNLVKFPLINPLGWKRYRRHQRLLVDQPADRQAFLEQRKILSKHGKSINAVRKGTVGKTDYTNDKEKLEAYLKRYMPTGDDFASFNFNTSDGNIDHRIGKQARDFWEKRHIVSDDTYPKSKWLYDTPGLVNENQVINKLTADELRIMLPKTILRPRVFVIRPGQVMFVSGLARLDYLQGAWNTRVTVHTSMYIPVHVVADHEADEFYSQNVGTDVLGIMLDDGTNATQKLSYFKTQPGQDVNQKTKHSLSLFVDWFRKIPVGSEARLQKLSALCARDFTFTSDDTYQASADIQLSSLGWVSFMFKTDRTALIRAYMPGGLGMYLRQPSLLPNVNTFRGTRKRKSPAYNIKKLIL